jgi:hypothetical protein
LKSDSRVKLRCRRAIDGSEINYLKSGFDEISKNRLVIFGEKKAVNDLEIEIEAKILSSMLKENKDGLLHIILSRFNFEMQFLLNDFSDGKISFKQLLKSYNEIEPNGNNITPYKCLFK